MNPSFTLVMLMIVAAELAVVIALLPAVIAAYWTPIADRYPPRTIADGARHVRFQSFNAAFLSLAWCIHVAADETHLHLRPILPARLLGLREASIPWPGIEADLTDTRRRTRRACIAGHHLDMPRWCLELATPRRRA